MLDTLEQNTHRELRAYVTVDVAVPKIDTAGTVVWTIALTNRGKTPANDVKLSFETEIMSPADRLAQTFPRVEKIDEIASRTIGPSQSFPATVFRDFNIDDVNLTSTYGGKGRNVCLMGSCHYTDEFGVNRVTNFFRRLVWVDDGWGLTMARHGNDAT
jgi:hypothetical protein